MKNLIIIIFAIVVIGFVIFDFGDSGPSYCAIQGCAHEPAIGSDYCYMHKCYNGSCKNGAEIRLPGSGYFCSECAENAGY